MPKKPGTGGNESNGSTDDLWYIFNDSKVTYSTFESFLSLSKKFPVDTAYVLFYKKINNQASSEFEASEGSKASLRKDLKMIVERDNINFMREKERSALSPASSSTTSTKGKIT